MKNILCVFGTRPEAIKMAPVILRLKDDEYFNVKVCITGQHRQMLDQVLELFKIIPDFDLNLMKESQTLTDITVGVLEGLDEILKLWKPDIVLVHGDTTTSISASLAAYYHKIKVGHIEAGLRSGDIYSPWPEEINRKLTSVIADYHFTPTFTSFYNLISENIKQDKVIITGNTVIDALLTVKEIIENDPSIAEGFDKKFSFLNRDRKLILVTGHRRENFGRGFFNICQAISILAKKFKNVDIVYPVHLNPNVRKTVNNMLSNINNVFLIEPQEYLAFVYLMNRSYLILTDSGGIQEEAPALGKPVLVMRNTTERPEVIEAGIVKLVGTDIEQIVTNVSNLLENEQDYILMSRGISPYGMGDSSSQIVNYLRLID